MTAPLIIVKVPTIDGETVYLNAAHIAAIEPGDDGSSRVRMAAAASGYENTTVMHTYHVNASPEEFVKKLMQASATNHN